MVIEGLELFRCTFPVPPSVNSMFIERKQAGKRGRTLSWDYQKWRNSVGAVIHNSWIAAGSPEIPKPFMVNLDVGVNHQSDIDNRTKGALDALCKAVPTPGDQWINRIVITRAGPIGEATISVFAEPV